MDIANAGFYHVVSVERVKGNFVARNDEVERLLHAAAHNAEFHFRPLRTAQLCHDAIAAHFHAGSGEAINAHDAVAREDSDFLARSFAHGLDDHERIFQHIKLYADAFEVAMSCLVSFALE